MSDDNGLWTDAPGPLIGDFEDPPEDEACLARRGLLRVLRTVGVLVLIAALLAYFVAPFNNFFIGATTRWLHPDTRMHLIPLAPERSTDSTAPA